MVKFINRTYKLDLRQYGFHKESGTQSAILDAKNFIQTVLDYKAYVVAVLDTVEFSQ